MQLEAINHSDYYIEQVLRKLWRSDELLMIGEYQHSSSPNEKDFGYISNPYINDRQIYYPENGHKRYVSIRVQKSNVFIEGQYYKIKAKLAPAELRLQLNNPYLLIWDDTVPIIHVPEFLNPQQFIHQWFIQTGSSPKDAATIASQLKLNSLELYTQTERFIFELIQNADDMPASDKGVKVELHLLDNFLLFRHNGKFFDRDDVRAIADAAQSNKSENVRQTGYKGIGFKSVFTDSACVYIRSGSYSFKFDKNDPIYKDFWSLYSWYSQLLDKSPKDFEKFKVEYENNINKYESIDNIPWQIKPIWVNKKDFPRELIESKFVQHAEVNIALEIGENIFKSKNYALMIESILSKPKFILFLRNTVSFEFFKLEGHQLIRQQNIELIDGHNTIRIKHNDNPASSYSKKHYDIGISNDEFRQAGFYIQKYEEKPDVFKFKDEYGEIKNIPDKLCALSSTRITFASKIEGFELFKLDKNHSILYNYLPTSDQRFGFTFLVNADFITSTSREFILKENKWNHYLMYHIGRKSVEFITDLVSITEDYKGKIVRKYIRSYLNLLPDSLLDETDEELSIIFSAYNRGFLQAIKEIDFIVDSLGVLKKCNEIIIDETIISRILGNTFFKNVSETEKELPFWLIDDTVLRKDYLNIERFTANELVEQLHEPDKQELLKQLLLRIEAKKYDNFLKWLDHFFHDNIIDRTWLFELPFVRIKSEVYSIKQVLIKEDFLLRTAKTRIIEEALIKLGFELSEFLLDQEDYKHIYEVVLTLDSYLKSDLTLYKHLIGLNEFSSLTANDKNTLITFFQSLENVDKAKYAKTLPMFKCRKDFKVLKPLNNLISNSCVGLPDWLTGFMIDREEENALLPLFQKELLNENELLEHFFCNPDTSQEIISGLSAENITDFYTYLLKLRSELPEGTKIDFSGIPWVYIESAQYFVMPSEVYWPDSVTKLSIERFENVKSVLESMSDVQIPCYHSLPLKTSFNLGQSGDSLLKILTKPGSFDQEVTNDFLDWIEKEDVQEFFSHFNIEKQDDKYSIFPANGNRLYYTQDKLLKEFVVNKGCFTHLILLPAELHSKNRQNIGLLDGLNFLEFLIEQKEHLLELASFILNAKNENLAFKYLNSLDELQIDSNRSYNEKENEFKVLKLVAQWIVSDKLAMDDFRNKIILDGRPLLEKAVSADIKMYDSENKFVYEFQQIELSDVLPSYRGKTYSVSDIVDLLTDFRDSESLRKIFRAKGKGASTVYHELTDAKIDSYDPAQTFFLSYFQSLNASVQVFRDKTLFTANYIDATQFELDIYKFLDICFKENNYHSFISQGIIPDFKPELIILDHLFCIEEEKPPHWLSSWLNRGEIDSKQVFLKLLGVNLEDSFIVSFRKAILANQIETINRNRELIENDTLLINTVHWLAQQQLKSGLVLRKEVLQPLYQKLSNRKVNVCNLLFPCLIQVNDDSYSLAKLESGHELHLMHEGWGEYKQPIFNALSAHNKITNDVLPRAFLGLWKVLEKKFSIDPDLEKLRLNSEPFSEEYYQQWDLKEKYPIFLYKGAQLPFIVTYNNLNISSINEKLADYINNSFYVVKNVKAGIFDYLAQIPQFRDLQSLRAQKQKFDESKEKEKWKVKYTQEELELLSKLFGNDIPPDFYKSLNLASLITGLIYLNEHGFDVTEAERNLEFTHERAELTPVFTPDRKRLFTVMGRSAKSGLLYMTARAWNRLDDENIWLFVTTGNNDNNRHLFKEKQDILDISKTNFQVFRVEAESKKDNTDSILGGRFDPGKIWLLFKMNDDNIYKPIFDAGIRRNEENPDIDDVASDEDE